DKARADRARNVVIDWMPKLEGGKGSGGGERVNDLAYGAGYEKWKNGTDSKDRGEPRSTWESLFNEAKPFFEKVAASPTSIYQDAAYQYLVMIPYDLGDYPKAIAAGKAAHDYWDSPAGKKRAADEAEVGKLRPQRMAAVDYWVAQAQHDSKNLPASL